MPADLRARAEMLVATTIGLARGDDAATQIH